VHWPEGPDPRIHSGFPAPPGVVLFSPGGVMYEKPKVERLGSLRELTQTVKWLGANDGFILGDTGQNQGFRS
jgi:hypothetical protein